MVSHVGEKACKKIKVRRKTMSQEKVNQYKEAKKNRKETVKKETVITIQHQGNEITVASVEEKVTAAFVAEGHKASTIKTLSIYVKPEEYAAYYVINDEFTGRVYLF